MEIKTRYSLVGSGDGIQMVYLSVIYMHVWRLLFYFIHSTLQNERKY